MAMTKQERADMELLAQALREARALAYSNLPVPEKQPVPKAYNEYVHGWDMNPSDCRVYPVTTTSVSHHQGKHLGPEGRDIGWSQNGLSTYKSRRDALIALRLAKEQEFARILANIDELLETIND